MRTFLSFIVVVLVFSLESNAQVSVATLEQYPVFPNCENKVSSELAACFKYEIQSLVYSKFKVPQKFQQNNYKGIVNVLFEVDKEGEFKVQYVDAIDSVLVNEAKYVFSEFSKIKPATYSGQPTYSRYSIKIHIPLLAPGVVPEEEAKSVVSTSTDLKATRDYERNKELTEFDSIVYHKFDNPQFKSHLNVPFTHIMYSQFDAALNQLGSNNHTASKPYTYAEVSKYYDWEAAQQKITKNKIGWWGRKLWNEHMVAIQGEGYWFTLNPIVDLRLGKNSSSEYNYTYQNTRGIQVQGGIGKNLNFTTTIYESQGRFADYFNQYARSIKPSGGNPAIIPGVGIAKEFKTDAFDFPLAEANITFAPSQHFDLQLGYGRNFLGDGYRSLILGDGASPYPYFKINTNFWKIKYTNTYTWLKDVREVATEERTYTTKFMANHYLSWNVTKKWNLGFFESVVWANTNDRGFDMSFVNPIIFYRAVEFTSSSKSGNALLGLTSKYKWNNQLNIYGQFLIDEFSFGDVKSGDKSWKNKFGYQIGAKYYNALQVENLTLQLEYNHVRPYVYSHSEVITNYGHNNQSLGHQWGGNFEELVAIARYFKGRVFADAKFTVGKRGLDFDTVENPYNYGGNIYKDYEDERPYDTQVTVGQGNKASVLIADLQAGYIINPSTNFKVFGNLIYRNFDLTQNTLAAFTDSTVWFSVGIRADLFNWYFDY